MGGCVSAAAGPVELEARLDAPAGAAPSPRVLLRLLRDGRVVAAVAGGAPLRFTAPAAAPGAYRVEAFRYRRRVGPFFLGARPWLFSNPIHLRPPGDGPSA
jgi:hypothetical protein